MSRISVKSGSGSYDIIIENGALDRLRDIVDTRCVVVVDSMVWRSWEHDIRASLQRQDVDYNIIVMNAGEENKTIDNVVYMYGQFNKYGITKSDYIVCIGGGVLGDMTAFAGATYLRGVDVIQVPTTLLAMVDSSVGGKSAVDMPFGKNAVGVIKSPRAVLVDPTFLTSLDDRQYATGVSEILKSGLIRDERILVELEREEPDVARLIELSLAVKADVVMADEFESGERMILNFGHTLAHAIEALGDYVVHTHGEAVAIGMNVALALSEHLLGIDTTIRARASAIMSRYHLPTTTDYDVDALAEYIARDKKARGSVINFVLLSDIAEPVIQKIELDRLRALLHEIM